jgi:hypothetical protein
MYKLEKTLERSKTSNTIDDVIYNRKIKITGHMTGFKKKITEPLV